MYDVMGILAGIIGGFLYAGVGYLENRKQGELFDAATFLSIIVFGAIVGAIMGLANIPVNAATFASQSAVYGYLAIIIKKGVFALFGKSEPIEGGTFMLPRDGLFLEVANGWGIRLNPSKYVAKLPDELVYQAVSPRGRVWSGNKENIEYLVKSDDQAAKAWRERFG